MTRGDELLVLHDDLVCPLHDRDLAVAGVANVEHDGAFTERSELLGLQLRLGVGRAGRGVARSERGHGHRYRCDSCGGAAAGCDGIDQAWQLSPLPGASAICRTGSTSVPTLIWMADDWVVADTYRFYGDLAPWWPLISPPEHYAEEAAFASSLLRTADGDVHRVLELGSGGGSNASHMKTLFEMTLVDLSPSMLDVSTGLNPDCEHILGDMLDVRLGRTFDAVFVHDAIDYMTTESDLRQAIETTFVHCRPGGVAVLVPDHTTETFEPAADHGGIDGADGRGVRFSNGRSPMATPS